MKFEHISVEKGLSHTSVKCILQDHMGYLWIGTLNGLNRYDGYRFVQYKNIEGDSSSISNNAIISVIEDDNKVLWIATDGGGINRYNRMTNSFERFVYDSIDINSISSNKYLQLAKGKNGKIWVGTFGEGLNCFDTKSLKSKRYKNDPANSNSIGSNFINCMYEDKHGMLWIGTEGSGLDRLEIATGKFEHFVHDPSDGNSISFNYVSSIFDDSEGRLWITTFGGGINQFDRSSKRFIRFPDSELQSSEIWSSITDSKGNIWLGFWGGGLAQFDSKSKKVRWYSHDSDDPATLSSNIITALYFDNSNILWIGTLGGGLNKLQFPNIKLYAREPHKPVSLSNNSISSILCYSDSIMWVGTASGLNKLNRKTGVFEQVQMYPLTSSSKITALAKDNENNLWIADNVNNIMMWNVKTKKTSVFPFYNSRGQKVNFEFHKIIVDKAGDVWASGYGIPLCVKKQNSNKFSSWRNSRSDTTSIAYNMATDVVADPDGTFWIATFSCGIEHFDRIKNTFTHYKFPLSNPDYLSLNIVLCLYQDDENSLWAGTFGGLVHFDKTSKKLKVFSIKDGMSDNSVYGILEDGKHNLWLSTGNGITRFNHKTGECKTFGVNNGLQGYSFNQGAFARTIDGELFFGGEGGINSFFPDSIKHTENPPKIAITGVNIFDKDTRFEQSYYTGVPLDLPYYKNFLEIAFSAFDFSSPEVNRYSYYLEGLEKTWQAATPDHIVKYSNLAPGEYIFHVRAANSEGVWNNKSADLKISIRPPFWAAVWFRVLMVLAVLLAILFLYIRRVRYLQRETLIQQNFSKQLIELQEDERKRIASELHDELGQNLLIINNHAKIGLRDISSENIKKQLAQISETALASINEVRNIAYNLHPYQLDDLGLNNTVESLTTKIAGTTGIIFTVNLEQREKGIGPEAEINVFRIIQESINNAVKHAAAKNVTIKLHYREQMLHLNISDDGIGMNKEKLDRVLKNSSGFGLKGIQERVRHQKGSFSISSTENEGTNLHIKLPVPN